MRPQTAILQNQHKKIYFNQQSGNYYILNQEGKQLRVNKRGQLIGKFVNDFTGFFNFKERKNRSLRDKCLMYTEPKTDYDKENNFICPKGPKLLGYAQYPYHMRCETPDFLEETTYKESCEIRFRQKQSISKIDFSQLGKNGSLIKLKKLNKFQLLKLFRPQNSNFINFKLINQNKGKQSFHDVSNQRQKKLKHKEEPSIILKASQKYGSVFEKRKKPDNCKSISSFHNTNQNNPFKQFDKTIKHTSYFDQSLSNIEKTQTPNYMQSNMTYSDLSKNTFNNSSIKSKCYKNSCHYLQYVPKRRYMKQKTDGNTVTISQYQQVLDEQQKQKKIVKKLQSQLRMYQPIFTQQEKRKKDDTSKNQNKLKPNSKLSSNESIKK